MIATCSLSPISLQIAPLWMWLMSAWWFNMVIPPAALASPGVEFVVLAIKATFDQQLRSIVNSTIPIKLECLTARANAVVSTWCFQMKSSPQGPAKAASNVTYVQIAQLLAALKEANGTSSA